MIDANVNTATTMVAAATALIAGLMTIAMGVFGRFAIIRRAALHHVGDVSIGVARVTDRLEHLVE